MFTRSQARAEASLQTHPVDDRERCILAEIRRLEGAERKLVQSAGAWNVPIQDGRLLRVLAEAIQAKHVIELGTSNGYSGLWLSLALVRTGGRLTTFEVDPRRAAMATANFERAGVLDRITIMVGDAHRCLQELLAQPHDPIDMVFIDTPGESYLAHLKRLKPSIRPGGLICAHNMAYPAPDPQYIHAITTDPELDTLFLNMSEAGIGVTLKKR